MTGEPRNPISALADALTQTLARELEAQGCPAQVAQEIAQAYHAHLRSVAVGASVTAHNRAGGAP